MAQAPLDVPGAGCATKKARGRERERVAEGARRKFIGGESRDETRSRGCSRGEGGGGWRRHERTPYSEGFQAAVYGPGQRDQDQPRARQGEREPRLVERSERSLGGFSGARVGDLEPRRCVPSRSATSRPRPRPVQSGRECLAGRASTHGDERRRSAGSCSEHVPGARKAHQATPGALIVDQSRGKRAIAGDIGRCTPGEARSRVGESRECIGGLGMTLLQARGANAARSRTVPMFAALAPLLIFVGFDGVVHGVARSAFHQDSTNTATGPIFVAPVGNQTAAIGREVVFSCSVRNISIRKYKVGWLRNSDQTILSIHTRIVTHNARISVSYESGGSSGSGGASGGTFGVTGSSQATEEVVNGTWRLHIRQLKETDRGCYMCQINTSPMISELGCLDIHVPPDIVYGDTSADLAVAEGDNATLSCRATGHPPPRVSWRREDGDPIVIRASTVGGSTFEKHDHYNGSLLHFHRVERRQMGAYLCIASNDVPPAVSKRVTLAVNFAPVVKAPNQLLGAPLGTDVQLECYVEAFPNTINYWVKNQRGTEDEMLLEGPKYNVREERTGYTVLMWLLIKKFTEKDVGSYKCVSTNSLGKADGTLRLYEIKIGFDRTSRKDHVSIIGGLAEAAQSSGASNGVEGFSGSGSSLSHILSMFFFIPILWPR